MRRRIGIVTSVAILVFGFAVFVKGCGGGGGGSSAECNDGVAEGNEDCDGADLAGESCISLGHGAGTLSCDANCTFNESACYTCGNNTAEGPEDCDGADLGGTTCQDRGYDSGTLGCTGGCSFDESNCEYADTCGDGTISGTEQCDGANLGGEDCESQGYRDLAEDYPDSTTLACSNCTFDVSGCGPELMTTCTTTGNHSIAATGTVTCAHDTGNAREYDWYTVDVQAGDCVDIRVDNGAGAADLFAVAINTDGNDQYWYGEAYDYSELDDEWTCTTAPWHADVDCPSASVEATVAGTMTILVAQWEYNGTQPGVDRCNTGLSEYTLFVAVNGTDASPVLTQDDVAP